MGDRFGNTGMAVLSLQVNCFCDLNPEKRDIFPDISALLIQQSKFDGL